jgi:AraC family transcriptional regulator
MPQISLIDFIANVLPPRLSVKKRIARDGLVVCRHATSSNPGSWMGATQVTLVMHEGAPFELAWRPLERRRIDRHIVAANQFHLTPADTPVHVAWQGTQHSITIAMTSPFIQRAASEPFDGKIPELRPMVALRDPAIADLASCLRREMSEDNPCKRLCLDYAGMMLVLRLFTTYGEETKSLQTVSGGLGASRQRRILDYIDAHLSEDIGLDDLAGEAGLSSYHFGKAFKASLGVPPCRYVTERRIHRAKELLLGGHGSITEIAHDLGFSSHSHFTDVFRKTTGATPSRFRRDRI